MKKTNILLGLSTATLLAAAWPAWADSPSDMLEQGVYSEETKGDLDGAMQIYQKVIGQAKSDQAVAAQAEYHLGICYYKKNDFTNANATFEKLITDYPDQKDIIALARKYLAGVNALQPAPWVDGEDLRLNVKLAGGMKVGIVDYGVHSEVGRNGDKMWRINTHMAALESLSASEVEVAADTFAPIRSYWHNNQLGTADAVYFPDHVEVKKTGSDEIKKFPLTAPILDNEEAIEWMRRLPLTNGYTITQNIFPSLVPRILPVTLNVTAIESVAVAAGTFNCYKVELSIGQTFWYSADANRYLVKFEAGGVTAELNSTSQRMAGEKAAYSGTMGFSVTAPAGWHFYDLTSKTNEYTILGVIDSQALALSTLGVRSLASLSGSATNSLRGYANHLIEEESKIRTDYKPRGDSWTNRTVAGQPGLSFMSDYTQNEKPKVAYTVCSFVGTNGVAFVMSASAEDLTALQPGWNSVIDSFQSQ
jgi:tetratricopeptide (TPR) repeat protein